MPKGLIFWILMLVWLVFGIVSNRVPDIGNKYGLVGNSLLIFVLFFLLGWKVFGFMVQ